MSVSTTKVTNISSGIYFKEIDLTIITQSVGTFAGGMIGLTEKGPAFQIMSSATFGERTVRLGDLNPLYNSSYYAREFLEQANNYKEVRILGLEGYNESIVEGGTGKSFAILYDVVGVSTRLPMGAGPFTNPVIASMESLAAILKPRRTAFTQFAAVDYVEITATLQRDGITTDATDDLFALIIHYVDPLNDITIPCSLRPENKEYIANIFGTTPRDLSKIQGRTSPLWVDFVYPSLQRKPSIAGSKDYYYPGTVTAGNPALLIAIGDVTIQTGFTYLTTALANIQITPPLIQVTPGTLPLSIVAGTQVAFAGTGNLTASNLVGTPLLSSRNWYAGTPLIVGTEFTIYADEALTIAVVISGVYTGGTITQAFTSTWETEVMSLGGPLEESAVPFQTPITPWFVSDANNFGDVQRLFKIWSISDGDNANTEVKLEISNINPDGNFGFGSFDLLVRQFADREDQQKVVIEAFSNLTLNPKSDNYVKRRLGDGENFPLRSRYIFIEMNETDELPTNALPYGVEGYVGATGIVFPDVVWTNDYDFSKPLTKQMLGLAHNKTNMFAYLTAELLSFKNVANLTPATGVGFHLNPNNNSLINTSVFTLASQDIYKVNPPINANAVSGAEKTKRSKYVVALAGGFDAFNVYKERDWSTNTSLDFKAFSLAVDIFSDNENLEADFSVLVTPDINFQDHASATELVLEMVTARGDALYIPDFRYDISAIPENAKLDLEASNMKSNFTAIYFPHVQIEDTINKVNLWLPPSIIALATIAATATNEQVWQPPAGSLRTITSNLIRTRKRMRLADREILKSANINPITLFPGSGFEITESRTTQEVFSALSFVHNRLLLGYAKKALNQTLRPILHQLNTVNLRNAFVNTVTPIFDRIKKLNGLEDFQVSVTDNQEDRTTLYGAVTIVPLYPIERIQLNFVLQNGAISFNQ